MFHLQSYFLCLHFWSTLIVKCFLSNVFLSIAGVSFKLATENVIWRSGWKRMKVLKSLFVNLSFYDIIFLSVLYCLAIVFMWLFKKKKTLAFYGKYENRNSYRTWYLESVFRNSSDHSENASAFTFFQKFESTSSVKYFASGLY